MTFNSKNKRCEKLIKQQEFTIKSLNSEIVRLRLLIPNGDDCNNCEVLMTEISKIRYVNASHGLRLKSSLALGVAMDTCTLDELFLTKRLLKKYQLLFVLVRCLS